MLPRPLRPLLLLLACAAPLVACKRLSSSTIGAEGPPSDAGVVLAGTYTITSGANPGGRTTYSGKVKVVPNGYVYDLHWILGGKPAYDGVGVKSGSVLGVGWGIGGSYGVVVYKVTGGRLEGTWAAAGATMKGREVLSGAAGLTGTYEVTEGKAPTGESYTGKVTLSKRTGDLYAVDWRLSVGSYSGVGIREGDVFVVGYGSGGQGAGVVSYRLSATGDTWTGRWATPGDASFGTENLRRD